jgi:hypothetical protein
MGAPVAVVRVALGSSDRGHLLFTLKATVRSGPIGGSQVLDAEARSAVRACGDGRGLAERGAAGPGEAGARQAVHWVLQELTPQEIQSAVMMDQHQFIYGCDRCRA